ncbi:PSD1 and planctomycete cytochrome C domain-containing protein [Thalassoglobus sp. JC818]|uniref:PSD1 and planctomycete cytochrome C domain-containing protein n=1 Tax=Thalassoglobus sp. JC818 TaxID=3232136 RepID=UPI00345B4ACD
MTRHILRLTIVCLIGIALPVHGDDEIRFNRDIRPILSDKCFACHGPDDAHREGGIRFDMQDSVLGEADSGLHPIVPGDPDASELIARITSKEEFVQMPPAEANKPLTAEEIALLTKWIETGAQWEDHWSWVPPVDPEVPEVADSSFVKNSIDNFILRRLEQASLSPNPEADRATLIRRVTLDLTGLPPTPEEVQAFIADESPDAYERVVDRLLGSERFGEHQARFWLDAARYGDTHGLHLDNYREMWPYRDWVVSALNDNMPFDQFITEQLAGDLLPNPTPSQLIATGFNRAHVTTNEGGSIKEEVQVRNVVDRVVTFGTVFMGATFECTRCHDHKFDPFTMQDFYSMYAYFNSIDGSPMDGNRKDHEPVLAVPSPEQSQHLAELNEKIAQLQQDKQKDWPELDAEQTAWEVALADASDPDSASWSILTPQEFTSSGGASLELLEDQSILASGKNSPTDNYTVIAKTSGNAWQSVRLEGLTHESLTDAGAGRSSNSNVVLTEFEVFTAPIPTDDADPKWSKVKLTGATADHEQSNGDFKVTNAIDGRKKTGWATEGFAKKEPRTAIFTAENPFGSEEEFLVRIILKHESVYGQHQFGRVRLSLSEEAPVHTSVPAEIRTIAGIASDERNDDQQKQITAYFRDNVTKNADYVAVRDALNQTTKERDEFEKTIPTTLVWKEKSTPEPAFILTRGEYDQPGEELSRRTPSSLPPMDEEYPNDRLGLAKWLIDSDHPLTTRVTVNRYWQQFFGTGLVKTSEDFGSQGEPPSHPELLDWLAVRFVDMNWDVKQFMKLIVMSHAYRQSSVVTQQKLEKDRANRLVSRGPRFRLDAEVLRDQALFTSGLLVERLGGPSVKPPQPDGLWFAVGYSGSNTVRFEADAGPDKVHRRTIYTFIKRTAPPPQMNVFDAPSRESCTVRRERTNTPMQALLLFNDPQYVETAIALAQRGMQEGGESAESIAERMLWLTLAREPQPEEIDRIVGAYKQDLETFQSEPEHARELIEQASFPIDESIALPELAAWTMCGNLLLNLDEVVTKN